MMSMLAAAVFLGAAAFSARWTWWRRKADGLPVLVYHKIGRAPAGSRLGELWVTPEKFRAQVAWLLGNGYTTLLFSDLLKAHKGEKNLPAHPVLITFDDGYENNYAEAYRILKELNARGNIFVVYNTIGKANLWHDPAAEPWINMAAPEMLREMLASGVIELGSHTMNHPDLEKISFEDAAWEIAESKKQLQDALGAGICAFAYPYGAGACNPALRESVFKAGYTFDFSFRQGKTPWPWQREAGPIDRLFIRGGDNNLDLYLQLTRGASRLF
ncbi:MAG: polysaccharide deacetylase family protein [Elusimicrobia bacterium]|nr:polysaccharide deacetylase family protein [Elusimicrobiota bacterium]